MVELALLESAAWNLWRRFTVHPGEMEMHGHPTYHDNASASPKVFNFDHFFAASKVTIFVA
jgi:hypothetical protein